MRADTSSNDISEEAEEPKQKRFKTINSTDEKKTYNFYIN
jgi:hypothetical protein